MTMREYMRREINEIKLFQARETRRRGRAVGPLEAVNLFIERGYAETFSNTHKRTRG